MLCFRSANFQSDFYFHLLHNVEDVGFECDNSKTTFETCGIYSKSERHSHLVIINNAVWLIGNIFSQSHSRACLMTANNKKLKVMKYQFEVCVVAAALCRITQFPTNILFMMLPDSSAKQRRIFMIDLRTHVRHLMLQWKYQYFHHHKERTNIAFQMKCGYSALFIFKIEEPIRA